MGPKIVVKLPLNKQVLNNNFKEIHWSPDDELSLTSVILNCNVTDFDASSVNIEELSTMYKVPIEFLMKKFVQIYNELQLKQQQQQQQEQQQNEGLDRSFLFRSLSVRNQNNRSNDSGFFKKSLPMNQKQTKEEDDEEGKRYEKEGEEVSGLTLINNSTYSYFIDKKGYPSGGGSGSEEEDDDDEEEDDDEPNLIKSSEFLLRRSMMLPVPKLDNSSLEDFFSDGDAALESDEGTATVTGQSFSINSKHPETNGNNKNNNNNNNNINSNGEIAASISARKTILHLNKATMMINDEDVPGIISTTRYKVDRKSSGASDLSNRSELERLLLDRL